MLLFVWLLSCLSLRPGGAYYEFDGLHNDDMS